MTTDTACSSSLVALHSARRSLQNGECDMAIVVGVNILHPSASIACATAGMLSPTGHSNTFDESADGYCRGEGCCAVVLKRESDLLEKERDHVYGSILGSAIMQDGKSANLTAPNGLAQELLLRSALVDAGVNAADVRYVEAHGTGTKLGDPIETEAMVNVYCAGTERAHEKPLYVGGVKAHVGHLEAAAGMAGLLAVLTSLVTKKVPGNCRLRTLNKNIEQVVTGQPIVFSKDLVDLSGDLRSDNAPYYAGLSSFGYSGTIAHMILGRWATSDSTLLKTTAAISGDGVMPRQEVSMN